MWFNFILYVLVAYGISFMFVYSNGPFHIFDKIRTIAKKIHPHMEELLSCMFCTPTWVGFGLSVFDSIFRLGFTPFHTLWNASGVNVILITMFDMVVTASSVYLINTIQNRLENDEEVVGSY